MPGAGAGATAAATSFNFGDMFSNLFSNIGETLMGTEPGQMNAYQTKDGMTFGTSANSGLTGGTPAANLDPKSLTTAEANNLAAANQANTGTEGLGSKLFSPEGGLAAMQMYSGIKQMNRDDEKFEIAKANNEEDRRIAKERRKGRIALGRALA